MPDDPFVTVTYGEVRLVTAPETPAHEKIGWWGRVAGFFSTSFTVLTKMAIVVSVMGLLAVTWIEVFNRPVVLEPIGIPKKLADMGFSKEVAAQRLWDAVVEINDKVDTVKGHTSFVSTARQLEVTEPGTGLSIQGLADLMRSLFKKPQTRVAGEFICTDANCTIEKVELRVRVFDGHNLKIKRLGPVGEIKTDKELSEYFHTAGMEVLRLVDPYILSIFLNDQGETEKAIEIADEMIASKNKDLLMWGHFRLGYIRNLQARYEDAKEHYTIAIKLAPNIATLHNNLGSALYSLGSYEAARESYETAIQLDPEYAGPHSGLGSVFKNLGLEDEAIASYDTALRLDSEYVRAYNGKGNVQLALGLEDDAILSFQKAIEADPEYKWSYANLGNVLYDIGRNEEALKNHEAALRIDPEYVYSHNGKGLVFMALGKNKDAVDSFQRAIELDPAYKWAHNNMGFALYDLQQFDEAMASHQRAIELGYDGWNATTGWQDAMLAAVGAANEKCQKFAALFPAFKEHVIATDSGWVLVEFEGILNECPMDDG